MAIISLDQYFHVLSYNLSRYALPLIRSLGLPMSPWLYFAWLAEGKINRVDKQITWLGHQEMLMDVNYPLGK